MARKKRAGSPIRRSAVQEVLEDLHAMARDAHDAHHYAEAVTQSLSFRDLVRRAEDVRRAARLARDLCACAKSLMREADPAEARNVPVLRR